MLTAVTSLTWTMSRGPHVESVTPPSPPTILLLWSNAPNPSVRHTYSKSQHDGCNVYLPRQMTLILVRKNTWVQSNLPSVIGVPKVTWGHWIPRTHRAELSPQGYLSSLDPQYSLIEWLSPAVTAEKGVFPCPPMMLWVCVTQTLSELRL